MAHRLDAGGAFAVGGAASGGSSRLRFAAPWRWPHTVGLPCDHGRMTAQPTTPPESRSATDAEIAALVRYWNAANYLTVAQIYLCANPLLREPLQPEHIKPRLLGHWGTSPGLSFIYAHLNRLIHDYDVSVLCLAG